MMQPTFQSLPPQMEQVLYQQGIVTVTSARFQVGPAMYPIRGITAILPVNTAGSPAGGIFLCVLGLFCAGNYIGDALKYNSFPLMMVVVIGVACLVGGVFALANAKNTYAITITTSGMNTQAYSSNNPVEAKQILEALHHAVAQR